MTGSIASMPGHRRVGRAMALAGGAILAGGCGSIVTTSGGGPPTTIVPGPSFDLGYLGPLSGPGSAEGEAIRRGADLAVQQFDADHPSYSVGLRSIDIGAPAGASSRAAALARSGVVGVVDAATGVDALRSETVLGSAALPHVMVDASADALAENGDPDFFRLVADDSAAGADDATFLVQHNATSVVLVNDAPASLDLVTSLTQNLAAQPVAVTAVSTAADGPAATASQISSISPAPDWVVFVGGATTGGAIVDALRLDGYSGGILLTGDAGDPARSAESGWVLSGDKASLICGCEGDPGSSTRATAFADAYLADYGVGIDEWSTQGFDAANVLLDAALLTSSQSPVGSSSSILRDPAAATASAVTPAGLKQILDSPSFSYPGLSGPISFNSTGNLLDAPVWVSDASNGRITQESRTVTTPRSNGG